VLVWETHFFKRFSIFQGKEKIGIPYKDEVPKLALSTQTSHQLVQLLPKKTILAQLALKSLDLSKDT
jgi:hypothetical protein